SGARCEEFFYLTVGNHGGPTCLRPHKKGPLRSRGLRLYRSGGSASAFGGRGQGLQTVPAPALPPAGNVASDAPSREAMNPCGLFLEDVARGAGGPREVATPPRPRAARRRGRR